MRHIKHINEFVSDLPYLPYLLMDIAKQIYAADQDYGMTFWNAEENHVWVCAGDSAELDEFKEKLEMIDGVDKISMEAECEPDGEGWYRVWPNPAKHSPDEEPLYDGRL